MSVPHKLDSGEKRILFLIERDKKPDGWTPVSEVLFPVVKANVPTQFVVLEKLESGGRAKLTEKGKAILEAMKWL